MGHASVVGVFEDCRFLRKTFTSKPWLTREQESDLAEKVKDGNTNAVNDLVVGNLRFVLNTVDRRYSDRARKLGIDIKDLYLIAAEALYEVARSGKFNPLRNYMFVTYAAMRVKKNLNSALASLRSGLKICHRKLPESICVDSLDSKMYEDGEEYYNANRDANQPPTQEYEVDKGITKKRLTESVASLDFKHRKVIELRFGINGYEFPHTLEQVKNLMGLKSVQRASQLEKEALRTLKYRIKREEVEFY